MVEPAILYQDNHLLVLDKPPHWIVQGASEQDLSLLQWGRDYIQHKYNKPGMAFLGVVSRLDRPVSGVVPFARTSKSAARLNEQIKNRTVDKFYLAVVSPPPTLAQATLQDLLFRDEANAITRIANSARQDTKAAKLDYKTLHQSENFALLKITLHTGRKHQIRAQLAGIGSPIAGDRRYGSSILCGEWIALHCHEFCCDHPTLKNRLNFTSQLPRNWRCFNLDLNH